MAEFLWHKTSGYSLSPIQFCHNVQKCLHRHQFAQFQPALWKHSKIWLFNFAVGIKITHTARKRDTGQINVITSCNVRCLSFIARSVNNDKTQSISSHHLQSCTHRNNAETKLHAAIVPWNARHLWSYKPNWNHQELTPITLTIAFGTSELHLFECER